MKKGKDTEKKARSRNLKGLSIFDDEIAAPADYGDFMKIDAPVALRQSSQEVPVIEKPVEAPQWEKFIGIDSPPVDTVSNKGRSDQSASRETTLELVEPVSSDKFVELNSVAAISTTLPEPPLPVDTESLEVPPVEISAPSGNTLRTSAPLDIVVDSVNEAAPPVTVSDNTEKKEPRLTEITPSLPRIVATQRARTIAKPQSAHEPKRTVNLGFGSLVGVQRRIILFMFDDCVRTGRSETSALTKDHLCHTLGFTLKTTESSIERLLKKGFLEVAEAKRGRGGWVIYRLDRQIYSELLLIKGSNRHLSDDVGVGPATAENFRLSTDSVPKHSDDLILAESNELASEWESIDISGLESIGFSKYHLKQLSTQKKNKLTPKEVQDSIHFFSFDLKRNNKRAEITGEPLNYFMGIVRNGSPYVPPANYMSEADIAEREMLKRLEAQKVDREQRKARIFELSFEEWKSTLSDAEKLQLKPDFVQNTQGPIFESALKNHFLNNVFNGGVRDQDGLTREQIRSEIDRVLGTP